MNVEGAVRLAVAVPSGITLGVALYRAWKSPERPPQTIAVIAVLLLAFLAACFL